MPLTDREPHLCGLDVFKSILTRKQDAWWTNDNRDDFSINYFQQIIEKEAAWEHFFISS